MRGRARRSARLRRRITWNRLRRLTGLVELAGRLRRAAGRGGDPRRARLPELSADLAELIERTGAAGRDPGHARSPRTPTWRVAALRGGRARAAGEAAGGHARRLRADGAGRRRDRAGLPGGVPEPRLGGGAGRARADRGRRDRPRHRHRRRGGVAAARLLLHPQRLGGQARLDGVDVVDGALTNPFAHAVATALAVAGAEERGAVAAVETELFRANAIESDDTSAIRIHLDGRPADRGGRDPVRGPAATSRTWSCTASAGAIRLTYTQDEVQVGRRACAPLRPRPTCWRTSSSTCASGAGLLVPIHGRARSCRSWRRSGSRPTRSRSPPTTRTGRRGAGCCPASPGGGHLRGPAGALLGAGPELGRPAHRAEHGRDHRGRGRTPPRPRPAPHRRSPALPPPGTTLGGDGRHRDAAGRPPAPPGRRRGRHRPGRAQLLGRPHLRPRPGAGLARRPRRPAARVVHRPRRLGVHRDAAVGAAGRGAAGA